MKPWKHEPVQRIIKKCEYNLRKKLEIKTKWPVDPKENEITGLQLQLEEAIRNSIASTLANGGNRDGPG